MTWSLDAASPDGGSFTLSRTGTIAFKSAPDFESPLDTDRDNDYRLTVIATDDGLPTASSRKALTIRVVNIDEPGTVALSALGPQVGVQLKAGLSDPGSGSGIRVARNGRLVGRRTPITLQLSPTMVRGSRRR